jgi:hypothetical protein
MALRLEAALVCACISAGCNAVFGVGDLSYDHAPFASGGSGGGGADGGTGGGAGSGGGPALPCGGFDVIADAFTRDSIAPFWTPTMTGGAVLSQAAGRLRVELGGSLAQSEGAYESVFAYDLTVSRAAIQVLPVDPSAPDVRVFFRVGTSTHAMELSLAEGVLSAALEGSGTPGEIFSTTYEGTEQRYWSLRADGDGLVWETSSDGSTWNELTTASAAPFDPRYVRARFGARAAAVLPATVVVELDDFGGDGLAKTLCPASDLTDDFTDPAMSPAWEFREEQPSCGAAESGGQLVITLSTADATCDYHTARQYDLRGSSVTARLSALPPDAGGLYQLGALLGPGEDIEIGYEADNLYLELDVGAAPDVVAEVFEPGHTWWRLREEDGTVSWETSANGQSWTTRRSAPTPPVGVGAVKLRLQGTAGGVSGSGDITGSFDDFNLP